MAFNQKEYTARWNKENREYVTIKLKKGKKDLLKQTAADHNTSVSQLIIKAVEEKYNIDLNQ